MSQNPPPSLLTRVLATWLVIFPLVALGQIALAPVTHAWNPVLRTALLTAVVVPLAVGLAVPRVVKVLSLVRRRRQGTLPAVRLSGEDSVPVSRGTDAS